MIFEDRRRCAEPRRITSARAQLIQASFLRGLLGQAIPALAASADPGHDG